MNREIMGVSFVILSVIAGVTFVGHQMVLEEQWVAESLMGKSYVKDGELSEQDAPGEIISEYEGTTEGEEMVRVDSMRAEQKWKKAERSYLMQYKIRM